MSVTLDDKAAADLIDGVRSLTADVHELRDAVHKVANNLLTMVQKLGKSERRLRKVGKHIGRAAGVLAEDDEDDDEDEEDEASMRETLEPPEPVPLSDTLAPHHHDPLDTRALTEEMRALSLSDSDDDSRAKDKATGKASHSTLDGEPPGINVRVGDEGQKGYEDGDVELRAPVEKEEAS